MAVYPDAPHFAFPFRRGTDGKVEVVEQSSDRHIYGQEYAVVSTPLGFRLDRPDFGWPWPEFSNLPLDLGPLRRALTRLVPESNADVTEWADKASQAVRHVRVEEKPPEVP